MKSIDYAAQTELIQSYQKHPTPEILGRLIDLRAKNNLPRRYYTLLLKELTKNPENPEEAKFNSLREISFRTPENIYRGLVYQALLLFRSNASKTPENNSLARYSICGLGDGRWIKISREKRIQLGV